VRVTVDLDVCETHGQCEVMAPDVFRIERDSKLVYVSDPDEALRADVEAAVEACPTQAIRIDN
jgi:ferredoxin